MGQVFQSGRGVSCRVGLLLSSYLPPPAPAGPTLRSLFSPSAAAGTQLLAELQSLVRTEFSEDPGAVLFTAYLSAFLEALAPGPSPAAPQ